MSSAKTNFGFSLLCDKCSKPLRAETIAVPDASYLSMKTNVRVQPCDHCLAEAMKPGRMLSRALAALGEQES